MQSRVWMGMMCVGVAVESWAGTGFTRVDAAGAGLGFSGRVDKESIRSHVTLISSGVAVGDVDGDGRIDLYFCSLDGTNALYRNEGDWRFRDVTAVAGLLESDRASIGAAFADVDGDGDLDLLTTARGGPNRLYRNDGAGRFTEDAAFAGRTSNRGSSTLALADIDADGDLDVYICNYRAQAFGDEHLLSVRQPLLDQNLARLKEGREPEPEFARTFYTSGGTFQERGDEDVLLLNDGRGGFTSAWADRFTLPPGAPPPGPLDGWGLCAQFRDVDLDGDPDLYVCNDFHTPDRFWINDGRGHFTLLPAQAQRRTSYYCMAVDFADLEGDGDLDFFTADMLSRDHARRKRQMGNMRSTDPETDVFGLQPQVMQNTLFANRGDGTYAEIAQYAGVKASEWTWSAGFADLDLDGRPDLVTATGMIHDWMDADLTGQGADTTLEAVREKRASFPPLRTRNLVFRNRGDLTFEEVGEKWGLTAAEVSGGLAIADLDNDGDSDLVFNNADAAPELYRNDSEAPRVAVVLQGTAPNTRAIGAVVRVKGRAGEQIQEKLAGGRYAGGVDDVLTFALPADQGPFTLTVAWPGGAETKLGDVASGRLTLRQAEAGKRVAEPVAPRAPLFDDVSRLLAHRHQENAFDDFVRQPLLPNLPSRLGPGVSWIDVDGDGDDDVLIPAARGGRAGCWRNTGAGFEPAPEIRDLLDAVTDQSAIVGFGHAEEALLTVGFSAWEENQPALAGRLLTRRGAQWQPGLNLEDRRNAVGPLALADFNGDGSLDFFLGGRLVPGRYPEPADSVVALNQPAPAAGNWAGALKGLGLASGTVAADFDGDGDQDLAVGCEWGPIHLLLNDGKGLASATAAWKLGGLTGWWNGLAAGDFDGDGRLDLIASNWGENSKYGRNPPAGHPLQVYYGDLDDSGSFDIVEAHTDKFTHKLVPERGLSCSSRAMPFVRQQTPTFKLFGEADLGGIFGDRLTKARVAEAAELRHLVLLNRGDHFEPLPLPREAQWAPAFGISVADFDGDGKLDAFLAQNFFSVQPECPRNDGGRGLLLLGDGTGAFRPADAAQTGIAIYGEQRGSAASDFDGDGRVDLLVAQNNDAVRLFRNQQARPGLRVRLDAGRANPLGIGAVVRPVSASGLGPARVVTAGSGYWSQESATLVFAGPQPVTALRVRWPGGREEEHAVAAGAREVVLKPRS